MNNELIYLGEDLGMGANKLWGADGGLQFLSQAATVRGGRIYASVGGMKRSKRPIVVKGEFGEFYVGANAHDFGRPVESLDFNRLTGTPEMRALWYGAMTTYQRKYGLFDKPLALMVGLPLQMMQGDRALEYQKLVREWMIGHHEWDADGEIYMLDVEKVHLAPQALGAMFDYAVDLDGALIADRASVFLKETGVLSIGFNTGEAMVVENSKYTENLTGGATVGVRRLLELVDPLNRFSKGKLDMKLRRGQLKEELKNALPTWEVDVDGFIEDRWGKSHQRFEKMIVVGGGAVLLKNYLVRNFRGKAYVPDNPVSAISRGLYKMLLRKG